MGLGRPCEGRASRFSYVADRGPGRGEEWSTPGRSLWVRVVSTGEEYAVFPGGV